MGVYTTVSILVAITTRLVGGEVRKRCGKPVLLCEGELKSPGGTSTRLMERMEKCYCGPSEKWIMRKHATP